MNSSLLDLVFAYSLALLSACAVGLLVGFLNPTAGWIAAAFVLFVGIKAFSDG